ncbi:MAG: TolC family protein, partial [Polyangiaceae bacterium]
AEARRDEALIGYAPDVLAGAAYTNGFSGSGSDLGLRGMLGSPFFHNYVAGVDASWNLVDLLRTPYAVRASEAGIDAAESTRAVARREIALAVIDLFERTLTAEDTRAVLAAEVKAREEEIGAVRTRVDAGMVAREQLLQAEAGLSDVEAEVLTASADERSARAALHEFIGDDRALTSSLRIEVPAGGKELPEIRLARAWRKQAEEVSTLRGMDWIPRLMFGGSAGYANPPPGSQPGYYAVGVALALPLTGTFRERARKNADIADAEARALEADATVEQLAVRTAEIDCSISGLEAALPAATRSREAAEQALAAVTARAEAGAVPQVDVEAAQAVLRRAELRERLLRLRLDGLKARRAFLTTSL